MNAEAPRRADPYREMLDRARIVGSSEDRWCDICVLHFEPLVQGLRLRRRRNVDPARWHCEAQRPEYASVVTQSLRFALSLASASANKGGACALRTTIVCCRGTYRSDPFVRVEGAAAADRTSKELLEKAREGDCNAEECIDHQMMESSSTSPPPALAGREAVGVKYCLAPLANLEDIPSGSGEAEAPTFSGRWRAAATAEPRRRGRTKRRAAAARLSTPA
jgi:hypothetical protein